jgi:hypothetical protein
VAIQTSPRRTIGLTACTPDTRIDNAIMLSTSRVGVHTDDLRRGGVRVVTW